MIWIVLLLAAGMLLFCREAYARLWEQGVEATVAVEEAYVYAGEKAHFTEVVANRGRLPLPEIEVRFRMPQGPVFENSGNVVISDCLYKRDIFALRPREQVTRQYVLQCPGRGRFPVSDLTVKAKSFFHHKDYEVSRDTDVCLTVFAAWTDVASILAHCDVILGSVESRRRTIEDPFAWASIRACTPQDPMRNINWKASARTGVLMVNTYASVQAAQYCVFLDTVDERIVKQQDLVELGISAAASLIRQLIRRGQEAGLYIYTDLPVEPLPPARGQAQLMKAEQLLAADYTNFPNHKGGRPADPGSNGQNTDSVTAENHGWKTCLPFAEWADRTARAAASDCICVFISKEEENLQRLEQLLRAPDRRRTGGQDVSAVLVQPVRENGREKLLSRIMR